MSELMSGGQLQRHRGEADSKGYRDIISEELSSALLEQAQQIATKCFLSLTIRIANEQTTNNNNPAFLFQALISLHYRYSPMRIHWLFSPR